MPDALAAAPLVLAVVLALAGVLKLRDVDESVRHQWEVMGVPRLLNRTWVRRLHPPAEVVLALALLVAPGTWGSLAALAALGLTLAYTFLVVRALRRGTVSCACLGAGHPTPVTRRTLGRNLLLTGLALASLVVMVPHAPNPVTRAVARGEASWLVMVLTAMLTAWLLTSPDTSPSRTPAASPEAAGQTDQPQDAPYLRTLTPRATLRDADGSVLDIVSASARRAHLLLFLSPGCGACTDLAAQVPRWAEEMPALRVAAVVHMSPQALRDAAPHWTAWTLYDQDGTAARMLRTQATPSAVLLGTDGMLAGGPVAGAQEVWGLVEDVRAQLGVGGR